MPNWCLNKLTVEHTDPAMVDRFVQSYNKGRVCEHYLPAPKDDKGELITDESSPDYWYTWCINNWGTKWDIGADIGTDHEERYGLKATVVGNQANCSFDSAWSPPIHLYEKLNELGYKVHASYFEPGMAFCGIWIDGYDNYIEYQSKEGIPVGVWNDFDCGSFFQDDEAVEA